MFNDLRESLKRTVFILLSTALLLVVITQISREYKTYSVDTSAALTPPLSLKGQLQILHACENSISGQSAFLQPTSHRLKVSQNCGAVAQELITKSPTFSYAYLILAQAKMVQGDTGKAVNAIIQSEKFAPEPRWLVERRVDFLIRVTAENYGATKDMTARDLARLLQSDRGHAFLTNRLRMQPLISSAILDHINVPKPSEQRLSSARQKDAS